MLESMDTKPSSYIQKYVYANKFDDKKSFRVGGFMVIFRLFVIKYDRNLIYNVIKKSIPNSIPKY